MESMMEDRFGRYHDYLRISVTDRCNLRCGYCMPPEGIDLNQQDHVLSYEELMRVASVAVDHGIRKIRLTGGEPLIRKDLTGFVGMLSTLEGLETIAMTTNGLLLETYIKELEKTRLRKLNISLDSLDPDRFETITRGGNLHSVLGAINHALALNFEVKINVVALDDLSFEEIEEFTRFARRKDLEVRFIEFMPLCGDAWNNERFRSIGDLREEILSRFDLRPEGQNGVSRTYAFPDGRGRIGFIASLTKPFCEDCSRLRLTSTGDLFPCLFSSEGVSLRDPLRRGATDEELIQKFRDALSLKWEGNPAYRGEWDPETEAPPRDFGLIREMGG